MRWRLLAAAGLKAGAVAQVASLAVLTNWLGYALLTGAVLLGAGEWSIAKMPTHLATQAPRLTQPVEPPHAIGLLQSRAMQSYAHTLQTWLTGPLDACAGAFLLALVLAWGALLATGRLSRLRWRNHGLQQPSGWVAATQLLLGAANWVWMAGVMTVLLAVHSGTPTPFALVLTTQLLASLAGLVARVPGGLGVLEAVYWVMLSERVATPQLLGALLVFRLLYFLLPLLLALPGYWVLARMPAWASSKGTA